MNTMIELGKGTCKVANTDLCDDDLREAVTSHPNGNYAAMICRGCGIYYVDPSGNHKSAKIVAQCKGCFNPQ